MKRLDEPAAGTRVLLMGNEAIARGAVEAGVDVAASYPGTPASEIMGTLARVAKRYGVYVEWSVNEKVALEVAAGASYAGARAMASMKQVGLNVAADPLMSLAYIGVKGGLVVVVSDDPGPHSSQTEQDTRLFARFAKVPVLDPSNPQEAKDMVVYAFDLSERLELPVIVRPTTRTSHMCADVVLGEVRNRESDYRFEKSPRWVIFPRLAAERHKWLVGQQEVARGLFEASAFNGKEGTGELGVVTGGVAYNYVMEALEVMGLEASVLKVGTPYPMPVELLQEFLKGVERVLVVEEQEPVLEDQVLQVLWRQGINIPLHGKRDGTVPYTGEFNVDVVMGALELLTGAAPPGKMTARGGSPAPPLPARPPVLCAGCPHRATFYAFKEALRGQDPVFTGDIGCYTLGNAPPLETQDTCLCMGASVTIACGLYRAEPRRPHVAFLGDSTFFHAGIPGLINAVYNSARITLVVMDNSTTAMTGHQPHPGLGVTATGDPAVAVDIAAIARACGARFVETCDPYDLEGTMEVARRAVAHEGPSVVIARRMCSAILPRERYFSVDPAACTDCGVCIAELGCPAVSSGDGVTITQACTGCGICVKVCPFDAIVEVNGP